MPFGERSYGRRYVIRWDDEVGRYHITLGKESIGFHKTQEGARMLVEEHVRRVSLTRVPFTVRFDTAQP